VVPIKLTFALPHHITVSQPCHIALTVSEPESVRKSFCITLSISIAIAQCYSVSISVTVACFFPVTVTLTHVFAGELRGRAFPDRLLRT
jgi:hypothetical protein